MKNFKHNASKQDKKDSKALREKRKNGRGKQWNAIPVGNMAASGARI